MKKDWASIELEADGIELSWIGPSREREGKWRQSEDWERKWAAASQVELLPCGIPTWVT